MHNPTALRNQGLPRATVVAWSSRLMAFSFGMESDLTCVGTTALRSDTEQKRPFTKQVLKYMLQRAHRSWLIPVLPGAQTLRALEIHESLASTYRYSIKSKVFLQTQRPSAQDYALRFSTPATD
eukprot:1188197-Prorocentrum_minimum.AAC.6